MARLRIRIELNRGGVGVPLHKLASVVEQAQKFFYLLTGDIGVDQTKGEWLGFDFGNESLNFTAEFVGPVTSGQVAAFHAAFDGTTSLRRTTIAQFARITEAIEQDELIGFGLYLDDEGQEPTEWRCLSRRDALRITEEIQLLVEASAEGEPESHLPAVVNTGAGPRVFTDRRERAVEAAKWTAYVREVEANMDRRITRVEHALEGQSSLIEDLHSKSSSTEDSVRKLLTAVEGFCAQTTRQLEAISASPAPAIAAAPVPEVARAAAASSMGIETAPAGFGAPRIEKRPDVPANNAAAPSPPQPARDARPVLLPPVTPAGEQRDWRLAAGFVLLGIGAVILGIWGLRALFAEPGVRGAAPSGSTAAASSLPVPAVSVAAQTIPPAQLTPVALPAAAPLRPPVASPAPSPGQYHLMLEASELTWVSLRKGGSQILARVFVKGDSQSMDVPEGAILRLGNAGGVNIRLNGRPVGPVGAHGQVREVVFSNGSYKISNTD